MIQLGILIGLMILKVAAQATLMPIMLELFFTSAYFIMFSASIVFIIFYGIFYLIINEGDCLTHFKKLSCNAHLIIFASGASNAIMSLLLVYSANPERCPVILQTVLACMPVIPSFFLRRYWLQKAQHYDYRFINLSFVCLILSVTLSSIPLADTFDIVGLGWALMYACGICFQSIFNVMQEEYIYQTRDVTLKNKLSIIFLGDVWRFGIIIIFVWLEWYIGYNTSDPLDKFIGDANTYFNGGWGTLWLSIFFVCYVLSYIVGIQLNEISTNYNMLIPSVANPIVALFFTYQPQYNFGVQYTKINTISSVSISVIGLMLWIYGESSSPPPPASTASTVSTVSNGLTAQTRSKSAPLLSSKSLSPSHLLYNTSTSTSTSTVMGASAPQTSLN